jgi:hypothetical protein
MRKSVHLVGHSHDICITTHGSENVKLISISSGRGDTNEMITSSQITKYAT